ncbi:toll-like receptor 13 [Oncorhynchus clarkii lewisi]|uniref:toll-like receptor 13 n=1 Tax=Oncorhynchus clarkii lewisi TaxID=490388 RepID=UPI0039B8DDFD
MINRFLIVYIDDIVIYSHSLKEHIQHVQKFLQRLLDHNLKVKTEKSTFHVTSVKFHGFVLTPGGAVSEVTSVSNWPKPTTIKELQHFIGFSNYYRQFIQIFSSIAAPLTALTSQKTQSLQWTDTSMTAFNNLKRLFTSAPVLCQPDQTLPFTLEVDSSALLYLDIKQNLISNIEDFAFLGLTNLESLDITRNKITQINANTFYGLHSLTWLDLRNNPLIHNIEAMSFTHLMSLRQVFLGQVHNPLTEPVIKLNLTLIFGGIVSQLTHLYISSAMRPMQLTIGSNITSKQNLSLQLKGQTRSADIIFHNLTKLEVLEMYHCRIYSLEGSLTKDLKSLKILYFHIENIYNVFYSFTEPLSSLKYLILPQIQIFCSCDNAWLITWAKGYRQVEVIMLTPYTSPVMYALEDLICLSDNGIDTPNFVRYTEANCTTEVGFVLFVATGLGVLFFMLVVLVHNLAGPYLLPLYHITLGWLLEAMRSNTRGRYHYDAFVSYSGKDERWVVEELLPNLEQRGPPFLRLCLHSRDFQLGKDIVENITDSLYRSRHTLCLVSRHYLRSNWCSLEMKLATYRLQLEQRDILLLVFLEKIPPRRLSAHHRLARLLKTRTYLDWPQDPLQHQAFWDRLWAKLKPQTEHEIRC